LISYCPFVDWAVAFIILLTFNQFLKSIFAIAINLKLENDKTNFYEKYKKLKNFT
jgi:hypothetical protein